MIDQAGLHSGLVPWLAPRQGRFFALPVRLRPAHRPENLATRAASTGASMCWTRRHSLMLKKPLLELAHVGGKQLQQTTPRYQILRDWIARKGAAAIPATVHCIGIVRSSPDQSRVLHVPHPEQQLSVVAVHRWHGRAT